jgi:hypothetical protein
MSIEKIWREASTENEELNQMLGKLDVIQLNSQSPLKQLKNRTGVSIVFGVLIILLYLVLFYYFKLWTFRLAIIIVVGANLWLLLKTVKLYQSIMVIISPFASLKEQLTTTLDNFHQWWKLQQKIGLIIFPIAITGGFTLGLVAGSGKALDSYMNKPVVWIVLGVSLIVFAFLGLRLTKKMYSLSYGKQLESLKENIRLLENS